MAYIGLVKPTVAKLDSEAGTYKEGFVCGKAIELSITPNYAEGSLYADDVKAEYDKEFTFAEVTLNTSTLPVAAHTVMFGHEVGNADKVISDTVSDEANYVGFGIYVPEKVEGVKKYVAMWLTKVKFTEGEETYQTKGDSIEYQTPSISGQAVSNGEGKWRERKICDTEQEAKDWIDTKAGLKQISPEG